jgi:hypothetical protein
MPAITLRGCEYKPFDIRIELISALNPYIIDAVIMNVCMFPPSRPAAVAVTFHLLGCFYLCYYPLIILGRVPMEKEQEQLIRMMENYYFYAIDKVLSRQDGLFKTYLWSASLAMALALAALKEQPFHWPPPLWVWLSMASLVSAFVVLVFCIDSLRGRPGQIVNFPDYWGYLDFLYEPRYDKNQTMKVMASDLKDQVSLQAEEQRTRALKLRASSKVLVLSFALLALAGLAYICT